MSYVAARRSLVTLGLRFIVGLVLIAGAFDILGLHIVSDEPERNTEDALTSRGAAARRADILWGGSMLLAGGGLVAFSLVTAARRRAIVEVDADGLTLRVAGPGRHGVTLPWGEVDFVRSTTGTDETGAVRALVVGVQRPEVLPIEPWHARWDGHQLVLDGDGWDVPPVDVAIAASVELERSRRRPQVDVADPTVEERPGTVADSVPPAGPVAREDEEDAP